MPLYGPSGGVSSVGLTTSGVLHSVSGSPLTSSGTIALNLLTQSANRVLAGPSTGADATPTMRLLAAADLPAHDASLLTTGTLADARLSANVPLLAAANVFSAAQTISATVAGPLAQINNASTTGAGLLIGSTAVASAGAGKIAPALALTQTVPATANYGLLSAGGGPWDGSTTGKFAGSANGTLVAGNAATGFSGNLLDLQVAGSSKIKADASGTVVAAGSVLAPNFGESTNSGPYLTLSSGASGRMAVVSRGTAQVPLVVQGIASQASDLFQAQNSAGNVEFGICNRGSGGSPIWALKVRATANSESMAQAHTAGSATGKAIEVMDDAGASLGFLILYA